MKIQKFREIEKMIFRYAYYTPPHPWGKGGAIFALTAQYKATKLSATNLAISY